MIIGTGGARFSMLRDIITVSLKALAVFTQIDTVKEGCSEMHPLYIFS